jgi:hypothetical protein
MQFECSQSNLAVVCWVKPQCHDLMGFVRSRLVLPLLDGSFCRRYKRRIAANIFGLLHTAPGRHNGENPNQSADLLILQNRWIDGLRPVDDPAKLLGL